MNIKDLYIRILYYLTAPKCVSCSERLDVNEEALCKECLLSYYSIKDCVCSVCFNPLYECTCSNDYLKSHYVNKLIKVFRYKYSDEEEINAANELIYNVKRDNRRDLVRFISAEIADSITRSLPLDKRKYIITSVPRSRARIIKYGFDHSREIAKEIAKILNIEYLDILRSNSKKAQKKMRGQDRFKNALYDYKKPYVLEGERVILIDDIVTTGASMGACATLIKGLGAKEIVGACMAVAYRDPYTPFEIGDY